MLLIDALCMIEREYYFITKGGKKKWRNKRDSVFLQSSLAVGCTLLLFEELSFERKDRRFKAIRNLIAPSFFFFFFVLIEEY